MPIARELRSLYSAASGWPEVRAAILARAEGACECVGSCGGHQGRCRAPHLGRIVRHPLRRGVWRPAEGEAGIRVILSVAHLNQRPGDDRPENLAALCQRCHLLHDLRQHVASRARRTYRAQLEAGQLELPIGRAA